MKNILTVLESDEEKLQMLNECMIELVLPVSGERFHVVTALVNKKHFLVGYARRR